MVKVKRLSDPGGMMALVLLADVVRTSAAVSATRSRLAKVEALSGLLREAGEGGGTVVGFLGGTPRQGRIGAGWRTLVDLDVPAAAEPSLTVAGVDRAFDEVAATGGKGAGRGGGRHGRETGGRRRGEGGRRGGPRSC